MELEEGRIYTNAELAQWFGISLKTLQNKRKIKLQYIQDYHADIEIYRGKIKVLKVYDPIYTNPRDRASNNIKYQKAIAKVIIDFPLQLFITCTGRIVSSDRDIEKLHHKFNTSYKYVRENLRKIAIGKKKIWCEQDDLDFTPLNKKQLEAWKKIISEIYNGENTSLPELESLYENQEISKEEYDLKVSSYLRKSWLEAKLKFADIYGFIPVYTTFWELNGIMLQELGIDISQGKQIDDIE